jgi:pimeloyl-ACP methyl ester carboxylesterase
MAVQGFTCLTIDAPWNCPGSKYGSFDESPYQNDRMGLSNIRKGLDLLATLDKTGIRGIFYVGHSFGADMAPRIAALDPRVKAIVVMSGSPFFSRDLLTSTDPAAVAARKEDPDGFMRFVNRFKALDAGNYIPYVHVPVLFQFGKDDEGLTVAEDKEFYQLANDPKQFHLYDAGHNLNDQAKSDRIAWLKKQPLL